MQKDTHLDPDSRLLSRVMVFILLIALAFAENALGYFAALSGAVPRITMVVLFVLCLFGFASVSPWAVFLAGLVFDLTEGNPPGYTSALLLAIHYWGGRRRRRLLAEDSARIWGEFILLMVPVIFVAVPVLLIYTGNLPAFQPLLFQYATTILIFPIVLWLYLAGSGLAAMLE